MRLDTMAQLSTRHADLLAEADAARLTGSPSLGLGKLIRKAGAQIAASVSEVRGSRLVQPAAKAAAKS